MFVLFQHDDAAGLEPRLRTRFEGGLVANNGAAGMPNAAGERVGLFTRTDNF